MRLEFRVLWFENQMGELRNAVTALRRVLEAQGLRLELDQQSDASQLEDLALQQERFHDYDLVLVDYDLGDGQPKGDEVAKRIRASFGFTDIIFYSGSPTEALREKVKEQAIDGVYCSGRRVLRDKLVEHAGFVVERLSRLEAMRGLAVVTASRGDDHLREVIRLSHGHLDAAEQQALITVIDEQVAGAAKRFEEKYKKLTDLEGRLESRSVTSMVLYGVAKEAVAKMLATHPHCEPQLAVLKNYLSEVIEPRNNLGHNVEVREATGWVVRSKSGAEVDKKGLAKFRKDLGLHLDNFTSLAGNLRGGA